MKAGAGERTVGERPGFRGRLLNVAVLDVELASGRRAVREVIRHPGAAVILAELPDGRFVLVEQYRKAVERRLLEAVAGTLGAGEDPAECARRELREETGYAARELTPLGRVYAAPGYTSERLHLYHALLEPERGAAAPDEDEALRVVCLERAELARRAARGEIEDAKTLAAWFLYCARDRDGGRARAAAREGGA